MNKQIHVIGQINPDTDSIASTIGYFEGLVSSKKQLGTVVLRLTKG